MASSRLEKIGTIFTRKEINANLLNSLSEVMTEMNEDYLALKSNQSKLQQLSTALVKCISQATAAQEQKFKSLNEIHSTFKKQVEGLIMRGGMRPDDRPVWFDVYKAFPPILEPKFARPKPDIKPIRQILYKEDELRVKFHSKGHGLAAVNMLNPTGETQTKNLIKEYEKQKALGVPEEEILDKCAETVISERKSKVEASRLTSNVDPKSITGQVLAEADIKNIFKEK